MVLFDTVQQYVQSKILFDLGTKSCLLYLKVL